MMNSPPLAGVMGWPIGHSRSPRLHDFWMREHKIVGFYVPLAVPPERLEQALRALPSLGFRGVNLTLPHKEAALGLVDEIEPLARRIGAVNMVTVRADGTLEGRNTDAYGFAENLRAAGYKPNGPATVLGAGGAARAVVVALQEMACPEIRLVNRTRERAAKLAAELGCVVGDETALKDSLILVNATSLGMPGQPSLEIDLAPLSPEAWVTDIVYTPLETDLLRRARARGLRTVDGLGMLLHQARPAFAAWFGAEPQVIPELRQAVLEDA